MTMQDILKAAGLASQPFSITGQNLVWAGGRDVLDRLWAATRSPRPDLLRNSEFVLIYGDYGSGKTHAMKYLALMLQEEGDLVAYVNIGWGVELGGIRRWAEVVRWIFAGVFVKEDIVERLQPLRQSVLDESTERAEKVSGSEVGVNLDISSSFDTETRTKIFEDVLPECPGFVRFMFDLADPDEPDLMDTNWTFLSANMTKAKSVAIAASYGIPLARTGTDDDAGLLLRYFCHVISHQTTSGAGTPVIHFLIDGFEDINTFDTATIQSMMQGLSDLMNALTDNTFFALSAAVSDPAELYGIFNRAIIRRLSRRPFVVQQLTLESAKQFLIDEMSQHRLPEFNGPPEWPFSPDGIEAFVNNVPPPITPRKLNVSAQRILFGEYGAKIVRGEAVDAADVIDFTSWGGG